MKHLLSAVMNGGSVEASRSDPRVVVTLALSAVMNGGSVEARALSRNVAPAYGLSAVMNGGSVEALLVDVQPNRCGLIIRRDERRLR